MSESAIKQLCESVGYGNVMSTASKAWKEKDEMGAFAVGPCFASVVPCGCKQPHKCDWCCGCGWVTKKVKEAKEKLK